MNSKSSGKVRELTQLMTVPEILAALGGVLFGLSELSGTVQYEMGFNLLLLMLALAGFRFIILSTAATLHKAGQTDIQSATDAAQALRPLAGDAAGLLFLLGMIGVGFLAVPVMTTGAAYDLAQTFGWRHSLHALPREATKFYVAITAFTLIGIAMNLLRIDAIKALFWSAVLNGVAAVPLIAVIVWLASNDKVMGEWKSSVLARVWGWGTVVLMGGATLDLAPSFSYPLTPNVQRAHIPPT